MHARFWNETTPIPEEFLENKPTQPTQPSQRSPAKIPAETQPREILELINPLTARNPRFEIHQNFCRVGFLAKIDS